MGITNLQKTKEVVEQFLEDLPATNDTLVFADRSRIVQVGLCECERGSVIIIIVKNIYQK